METKGTSQKVKLTEALVRRVEHPAQGKRLYLDTQRTGFGMSVSAKTKSWIVIRRVPGHGQVRMRFGQWPELNVGDARRHAEGYLAKMTMGHNPMAERREARAQEKIAKARGITLGEAAELTVATLSSKRRSERTKAIFGRPLQMYLPDWMNKPLLDITRADVRKRHQQLANEVARGKFIGNGKRANGRKRNPDSGRATADSVFRAVRQCFNRAMREHVEIESNPCINVDWHNPKPTRKAIPMEGLAAWYQAVMKIENAVRRDYLLFVLFSGQRRESAATMRWQDVNFERLTLHVPKPKGGEDRAFDLPLSDMLLEILQRRRAEHEKICATNERMKPWVWPAASASGHIAEPRVAELGYGIHDLRRTYITCATHWCKLHIYDVKLLCNHTLPGDDVTAGYVAANVEQLRAPQQAITDKLRTLCAGGQKIVRMDARRRKAA